MKYINEKDEHIYTKRPGSYAIIENPDGRIAIVQDDAMDLYFFGGGVEEGETSLDALKRELLEESGYSIKEVAYFTEVTQFLKSKTRGYIEVIATIYTVKLDEYVKSPIEKDHKLLWIDPKNYRGKLFREWQNYVLDLYIEYSNNQVMNDK